MTRIGISELREHAGRYLERVKAGEVVEVTERGKLIALLVSPNSAAAARHRLIAAGRLVPATSALQMPSRRHVVRKEKTASKTLTELREERFE
jgi:prevent-host-death family protein